MFAYNGTVVENLRFLKKSSLDFLCKFMKWHSAVTAGRRDPTGKFGVQYVTVAQAPGRPARRLDALNELQIPGPIAVRRRPPRGSF